MSIRRTNYSTPPYKKKFFSQYTTVYRPTLIITMYTILLFIHYKIMANYRIRYTMKNVFQIIFIQRKCHYYYYIYCNFRCKHGKTWLKVCKEELNVFETNKHMLNNSKHVFVVGLIINSYTYYYHTYKEVLLSGKPNVTYMIHFRNFLKRGTKFFFFFFFQYWYLCWFNF